MTISLERAEELHFRALGILAKNAGEIHARLDQAREDFFELREIVARTPADVVFDLAELNSRIAAVTSSLAAGGVMDLTEDQGVACGREGFDLDLDVRLFRKDVP